MSYSYSFICSSMQHCAGSVEKKSTRRSAKPLYFLWDVWFSDTISRRGPTYVMSNLLLRGDAVSQHSLPGYKSYHQVSVFILCTIVLTSGGLLHEVVVLLSL